jgi:hypothetical protein
MRDDGGTQFGKAMTLLTAMGAVRPSGQMLLHAPASRKPELGLSAILTLTTAKYFQKTSLLSCRAANYGLRGSSIRQKIIGHRMRSIGAWVLAGSRSRPACGTFPLLEKPAREHGRRIFVQPLVEQGRNFLSDVGGVAQA